MQRVANVITQQRRAMLGAENEMNVQAGERLWHGLGCPFRVGFSGFSFTQGVALGWAWSTPLVLPTEMMTSKW